MERRQPPQACPKSVSCLGENEQHLSACLEGRGAEDYVSKTPQIPAELLCLRGLENHKESRSRNRLADNYSSVCFDIDQLLALPNVFYDEDDGIHRNNRTRKLELINQIVMQLRETPRLDQVPNENLWTALQLKRLAIFMPAFRARALDGRVGSDLVRQTHANLVDYITSLDTMLHSRQMNSGQKKQLAAHMAESEIQALFTRKNILAWPALAREEASHARKKFNHDFNILHNDRKQMFQIKTSSNGNGYDSRVAVIQHYDVLLAMRREPEKHRSVWEPSRDDVEFEWPTSFVHEQILAGNKPDPLGRLLADEKAGGRRFDREKRIVLDLASAYVATRAR